MADEPATDTPDVDPDEARLIFRNHVLTAVMAAGPETVQAFSAAEDQDAWIVEHTATRQDGTIVVTWQPPAAPPEEQPQAAEQPAEPETATQAAVKRGNPSLPASVHRAIMNPVGGKSSREEFIDNYDISKLDNPDNNYAYFREARRVISESKPEDIRQGLMERTDRAWESGEFDKVGFTDMVGDLAR